LQCQNFERGDGTVASGSSSAVSSPQLSPASSLPKSTELGQKVEEEDKETKTSPYFKKKNSQRGPREINSKTVVRTIDLGSLASKLSRKNQKTLREDENALEEIQASETVSSSQKENIQMQMAKDNNACDTVRTTSVDTPTAEEGPSFFKKGHNLEHEAPKSDTVQSVIIPKLHSSPSKLKKRKKEVTSSVRSSGVHKKAKYEGSSRDLGEMPSCQATAETTHTDQHKTEVPSSSACDPPLSSEETHEKIVSGGSVPEAIAENSTSGESSRPPSLPYYLRNFSTVLHAVLENEDDRTLFNQDDMSLIRAFEQLSGN